MYRSKEKREESLARLGGKSDKTDWFRKTGATTSLFQTESLTSKNCDILASYAAHDFKVNEKKIRINECKMPGRRFF